MIEKVAIYCPTLKKKMKIEICIPKNRAKGDVYDSLYMLDGQNIYKDKDATFGRSWRMGRYLSLMSRKFGKKICGIAIPNADSEIGRFNEYTPFKLEEAPSLIQKKQKLQKCMDFTHDLIHTIIPFIRSNYPVSLDPKNTFILGSSLGALYASYLVNQYPNIFGVAGLFSNCPFICPKGFYEFMDNHINPSNRIFNYVGLEETSDGNNDTTRYFNSVTKYHEYLKSHGYESKLVIDINGSHCEAVWEKHILQFFSFIYFKDIDITI